MHCPRTASQEPPDERTQMALLNQGDRFPSIELSVAGAGVRTLELPGRLAGEYGIVLFYRGSWCPYCKEQLRAFQRAKDKLADIGARVLAVSVDDEATTRETMSRYRLEFPLAYDADAHALAEATGAFVNEDPVYLQSTGFVLDPRGRVVVSVYSSGAIGRLVPEDVIGLLRHERDRGAA
jgi:peroxiredoxin